MVVHLIQSAEKQTGRCKHTHAANYQCSSHSLEYIAVFGCWAENNISILYSAAIFELSTDYPSLTGLTYSHTHTHTNICAQTQTEPCTNIWWLYVCLHINSHSSYHILFMSVCSQYSQYAVNVVSIASIVITFDSSRKYVSNIYDDDGCYYYLVIKVQTPFLDWIVFCEYQQVFSLMPEAPLKKLGQSHVC